MCVDEHDDINVGGWGGAAIHKLSGETGAAISSTVGFVTGNTFDDVEDRIYSVGSLFGYSAEYGWIYTQVGASNVDNSEYVNYSVNYSGGGCNNVIVVDSNIFVVGGYMDGAGGAEETATVWKFDRNLNLLASANTGSDDLGVVLDWDGNIACYAGSIFTYTTDLVFVAEHEIVPVTHAIYGNEIQKIDYLYGSSEGVPGVPAVPAVETAVEVDPRRLVPFVRADEYSNVLALVDKNISFFEGD